MNAGPDIPAVLAVANAQAWLLGNRVPTIAIEFCKAAAEDCAGLAAPIGEPVRMLITAVERGARARLAGEDELEMKWWLVADALMALIKQQVRAARDHAAAKGNAHA